MPLLQRPGSPTDNSTSTLISTSSLQKLGKCFVYTCGKKAFQSKIFVVNRL